MLTFIDKPSETMTVEETDQRMNDSEMPIADRLLCSQIIFRHGVRTPLYVLPQPPTSPASKSTGNTCVHSKFGYNGVYYGPELFYRYAPSEQVTIKVEMSNPADISQQEYLSSIGIDTDVKLQGGADFGVLTTMGRRQLYDLGRKIYKFHPQYNALSNPCPQLRVHSSNIPRTLDSVQSFLSGFLSEHLLIGQSSQTTRMQNGIINDTYDKGDESKCDLTVIPVRVESFNRDFIFPNYLVTPVLNRDVLALYNELPVDHKLKQLRNQFLKEFDIHDYPNGILELNDELAARKALNLPVSDSLTKWQDIFAKHTTEEFNFVYGYNLSHRDYMRATVGRFLKILTTNMKNHKDDNDYNSNPPLYIYSSHDSTLHCLKMAFGHTATEWPTFASYLLLQLFKRSNGTPYLRITYNDQPLQCTITENESNGTCSLEGFLNHVNDFIINESDLPLFNKTSMALSS